MFLPTKETEEIAAEKRFPPTIMTSTCNTLKLAY